MSTLVNSNKLCIKLYISYIIPRPATKKTIKDLVKSLYINESGILKNVLVTHRNTQTHTHTHNKKNRRNKMSGLGPNTVISTKLWS